ncbi:MAG: hypothetical protein ACLFQ6_09390, partial [Candidatus Sumerlaeia bacterium]
SELLKGLQVRSQPREGRRLECNPCIILEITAPDDGPYGPYYKREHPKGFFVFCERSRNRTRNRNRNRYFLTTKQTKYTKNTPAPDPMSPVSSAVHFLSRESLRFCGYYGFRLCCLKD